MLVEPPKPETQPQKPDKPDKPGKPDNKPGQEGEECSQEGQNFLHLSDCTKYLNCHQVCAIDRCKVGLTSLIVISSFFTG